VPVLSLDAGNALFKSATPGGDSSAKARAELLLEQMDALGTSAMAVGARDLTLGTAFLTRRPQGAKMKLLSANLVDAQGKLLFEPSTVLTVGGVKFGVVGLSPEGEAAGQKGGVGKAPVPAALAESRRLRQKEKVDVVVVLAAVPYLTALELSKEAGPAVDFIIQSHEGRGTGMAQRHEFASLLPSGERGKQLARLELSVGGKGPFVDLTEAERARSSLKILEENIQRAKERLAAARDEPARKALEESLAGFEVRRQQLLLQTKGSEQGLERTHRLSYIELGSEVPDEPELKKRVEQLEPPGSVSH
jgi:2',3'-cyclic-nucleotide 2'-phosphodiesterase (5'-nucleotidase family)